MTKIKKYSHSNPVILDYILSSNMNIPSILDIGCWDGLLGKMLNHNKFKCNIDGIDIAKEMLLKAKNNGYRKIYHIDLNQTSISCIRNKYDLVILGDILEHLTNPNKLLESISSILSRGGYLIVSLPNIGFVKYRLLHMLGKWNYTETGIMDKTHLRFYTLGSMKEMFSYQKFSIIAYKSFCAVPDSFWYFKVLGDLWPSLFALQIIFKLKKVYKN